MNDVRDDLCVMLREWLDVHARAEDAYTAHLEADWQLREARTVETALLAAELEQSGKRTNEDWRKTEISQRIEASYPGLIALEASTERQKRAAEQQLERATERLKTYRALANHETATLQRDAARMQAVAAIRPELN